MQFDLIAYSVATLAVAGGVAGLTELSSTDIISAMVELTPRQNDYLSTLARSRNTVESYKYGLRYFNRIVGPKAQLNSETYVKFLKSLRARGLSPSTQQLYRTAVRNYYRFCKVPNREELDEADEHYIEKRGHRFPNPRMDLIEKFVAYCETLSGRLVNLRDRAFVILLADSGLRLFEACKLKRGDVDWRNERLVIVGKGDKQAVVRLSERAIKYLQAYLKAREKMDGGSGKPLEVLPLFARHYRNGTKTVRGMSKSGMWFSLKGQGRPGEKHYIAGRFKEAGLDPKSFRIHDLRHYFVTMILQATGNLKLAQELARHASVQVTERYAHLSNSELDRAYEEIFNNRQRSPTG